MIQRPSPAILKYRRALIEAWIERLIALLDELDGDENMEPTLAGFETHCADDLEFDPAESGIADSGGLFEQWPSLYPGTM